MKLPNHIEDTNPLIAVVKKNRQYQQHLAKFRLYPTKRKKDQNIKQNAN
jgi:hypothetical protein